MRIVSSSFKTIIKAILKKLGFISPVDYINGPETLPPPLKPEEEEKLFALREEKPEYVREQLITHNLRLVVYIARKYDAAGAGIEDLISIGTIGLIKAVNTFKADKNIKLATYASRCIENEILMYMRKSLNLRSEISIDEPLNVDWDGNELLLSDILGSDGHEVGAEIEKEDEKNILNSLITELGTREREIMSMRFGLCGYSEHTQKQVADILGISQSYISRLEKRIIEKLKKDIEKAV